MFAAIPGYERSLSVRLVFVAISALIADIIEPDDHRGRKVELLHCTHLVLEYADVRIPAGRKHFYQPGGGSGFSQLMNS